MRATKTAVLASTSVLPTPTYYCADFPHATLQSIGAEAESQLAREIAAVAAGVSTASPAPAPQRKERSALASSIADAATVAGSLAAWEAFHAAHRGAFFHPRQFIVSEFSELLCRDASALRAALRASFGVGADVGRGAPADSAADAADSAADAAARSAGADAAARSSGADATRIDATRRAGGADFLTILELGAGNGSNLVAIAAHNPRARLLACDYSAEALAHLHERIVLGWPRLVRAAQQRGGEGAAADDGADAGAAEPGGGELRGKDGAASERECALRGKDGAFVADDGAPAARERECAAAAGASEAAAARRASLAAATAIEGDGGEAAEATDGGGGDGSCRGAPYLAALAAIPSPPLLFRWNLVTGAGDEAECVDEKELPRSELASPRSEAHPEESPRAAPSGASARSAARYTGSADLAAESPAPARAAAPSSAAAAAAPPRASRSRPWLRAPPAEVHGGCDIVLLTFVLSAIPPPQQLAALRSARRALRPGGLLAFRDYGLYDHVQLRGCAQPARALSARCHVRADGTLVSFFALDELRAALAAAGFAVLEASYATVRTVNRRQGARLDRVFVHARAVAI